jgi:hypothetical protein
LASHRDAAPSILPSGQCFAVKAAPSNLSG